MSTVVQTEGIQMNRVSKGEELHIGKGLIRISEWIITVLLTVIALFLTITSYVYYIDKEDMSQHIDRWGVLLVVSAIAILLVNCLAKWISGRNNPIMANHILFFSIFALIMVASAWWIANARSLAQGDAASLHQMALSIIRDKDYSMITPKGSYLSLWPFQTGLLLYYEGILRIVPDFNVVPMQILNWAYLGVGLVSGYFLVRKWFDDERVTACFSVLLLFCWPWYFYVNFAYGEIPSISAMLFVTWMVTLYLENKRKRYLSFALLALTFGLLLRKNLSIFVVASVLVLIVSMLQGYKKHYLYAIVGIVTVTIIVNWLPTKIYEFRANSELGKGVSAYNYIAMGLQETEGIAPGWNNGYHSQVLIDNDYNAEDANEVSKASIRKSLAAMAEKPRYAFGFFYRKLVPEWCDPNFSCFYSTQLVYHNRTKSAWNIYDGAWTNTILQIMNGYQSLLYTGLLLYCVANLVKLVRRKKGKAGDGKYNLWQQVLTVTIIGGLLFYMFWEGGSRYTLPYMVCMLPYAAKGIARFCLPTK